MLAVVKAPRIEMVINGNRQETMDVIEYLRKKFPVQILDPTISYEGDSELTESIEVCETDWWKESEKEVPGIYIRGYRHKLNLTQLELSELTGIAVPVISDYENNKRKITEKTAYKLAKVFDCKPERFLENNK